MSKKGKHRTPKKVNDYFNENVNNEDRAFHDKNAKSEREKAQPRKLETTNGFPLSGNKATPSSDSIQNQQNNGMNDGKQGAGPDSVATHRQKE